MRRLEFAHRQVRHDARNALARRVDDDLRGLPQDLVHAVEIEPPGRDLLGRLIALQERQEGVGLAVRQVDDLHAVGLGVLPNVLRFAPGARQNVVGVGLGLVAGTLLVGPGALDVVEGVDHREGRLDALQLHLGDLDARLLVVQQLLQERARFVGDLLAFVGHGVLDRRAADDVAQRALGCGPHRQLRIFDPEQELARIPDLPEDGGVGLDDVFVAGQHLAAPAGLAGTRSGGRTDADLDLVDLSHLGQKHGLDRVGPMRVQARLRRRDPLAEAQHDALLVGLNAVERGREPREEHDRRSPPGHRAIPAAACGPCRQEPSSPCARRRSGRRPSRSIVVCSADSELGAGVNLVQRPDFLPASSGRAR